MAAYRPNASPLLSVVIPAYNAAAYIGPAISSVLDQLDERSEVIVVDDGSTDTTVDVIRRFGDRVRCIVQANGGLASARNRGQSEARGEFVAWFDHDDINEPDRFALQIEILRRYPDVGLVTSGFSAFNAGGKLADSYDGTYYGRIRQRGIAALFPAAQLFESRTVAGVTAPLYYGSVYPELALGNFVHPPTVMMRSAVWRVAGPLKFGLTSATDWEFLVRASRLVQFAYLDRSLLRYRLSDEQMTADSNVVKNLPGEMRAFELMLEADVSLRSATVEIRAMYRHWNLSLASAIVAQNRLQSLRYLARSLQYGFDLRTFVTAALHASTPAALRPTLGRVRRIMRRTMGSGARV